MTPKKLLIRGGCVLTLGMKSPNFTEADVLLDDGRIVEVGPGLRARDAEQVDAAGTIVMPGFVDTHRHAWKSLLRNFSALPDGTDVPPASLYGPHHGPDDIYAATLLGLLSAAENGITTVVDWADIGHDDQLTEAALQAHSDAGLRTVFVHAVPAWADAKAAADAALRRVVTAHPNAGGSRTTLAAGPPDPELADLQRAAAAWALARELGLRIHAHVHGGETQRGVVAALAKQGLLSRDVTLVHCADLDDADLDAVASSRTAVSLTPSTEMAVGFRSPPLQTLIDRGIAPGLGVDDELVAPGDLFAQMHAVQSLQHATMFDRKLAGKGSLPALLNTREVIRYATLDGARVAGLDGITGSLEPGKRADVLILRADRANIYPINDPIGAVVWGMDPSNVDWVFVDGIPIVRNGELEAGTTHVRSLAAQARQRIAAGAGGVLDTVGGRR